MHITKFIALNPFISEEDGCFYILGDDRITDNMITIYHSKAQDDIMFDRRSDSIRYVRIKPGYESITKSGNMVPTDYIMNISPTIHVLKESFVRLPKGIIDKIDINEYINANEATKNWDNIVTALSYIKGCDTVTAYNIVNSIKMILRCSDTTTYRKISRRIISIDPYIAMLICEIREFRKFLFYHITEYIFLKRHCENFTLSFTDLLVSLVK